MIQQNLIKFYEKSFSENWDLPALSDYNGVSYTYGEVAKTGCQDAPAIRGPGNKERR